MVITPDKGMGGWPEMEVSTQVSDTQGCGKSAVHWDLACSVGATTEKMSAQPVAASWTLASPRN